MEVVQGCSLLFFYPNIKIDFFCLFTLSNHNVKTFTCKVKSKTNMHNYDSLAACFEKKLNFLNLRTNYKKNFEQKLENLPETSFHLAVCQTMTCDCLSQKARPKSAIFS